MYINSRIQTLEDVLNQADTTPRYIKDNLDVYKDTNGIIYLAIDGTYVLLAFAPEIVSNESAFCSMLKRIHSFEYGAYRVLPEDAEKVEVKDKDVRAFIDNAYSTCRELTASSYREKTTILIERSTGVPYNIARIVTKILNKDATISQDELCVVALTFSKLVRLCAEKLSDAPDYEKILTEFRPLAEKKLVFFRLFGEEWYHLLGIENLGTKYTLALANYLIDELNKLRFDKAIERFEANSASW